MKTTGDECADAAQTVRDNESEIEGVDEMEAVPATADESARPARYAVPALEKGLEILELLASSPNGLNLTTIASSLGRSTGEIYRILQFLEARDYIVRDRNSDSYSLSMRLFHLSHEHPPLRTLVAAAVPVMEELASAAGQSCHLAVLSRTNITIVAQIDSPLPIRYSVRLGAQFPATETSSGILLCAFLTDTARRTLFSQLAQVMDEGSLQAFQTKLGEVTSHGYEERPSLRIPGIVNYSFAVRDRHGHAIAALTVPYLPQRNNYAPPDAVRDMVAAAAAKLSAAIGFRDGSAA
ncbi:MAG TPA: IclR family transcriptional regulator [Steroidobacter sp.]|uniref:IclR family transcriptional regulator n=1 Tax=Steroidobacter sp. TaxID=1978227 RepID=UPI002ED9C712